MDVDQDEKHLRSANYGSAPAAHHQPMQPSELPQHNYHASSYPPPSAGTASQGHTPAGWLPPPSPFANEPRHALELAQTSNSYSKAGRDHGYLAETSYDNRGGALAGPTRSPDVIVPTATGVMSDSAYSSHADLRNKAGYGAQEMPPHGSHNPALQVATDSDVVHGQPQFGQASSQSAGPGPGPGPGPSPLFDPYYQNSHWPSSALSRKKPVRAQQACDSCRSRKAKCDEARPCSHCKDNQLKCTYREIPPHKQDRNALALEAKLDGLQRDMNERYMDMNEKLNRILQAWEGLPNQEVKPQGGSISTQMPPKPTPSFQSPAPRWQAFSAKRPADNPPKEIPVTPSQSFASTDPREEPENTLPHRHSTAAQNLLLWPSIAAFGLNADPEYVMNVEMDGGLLRPYGRGVGREQADSAPSLAGSRDGTNTSRNEDSPSPPTEASWGYGFKPPGPSIQGYPADHPGGLNADGSPNYAPDLVDRYFESYLRHMHILHPFLDKRGIRANVQEFKSKYSRENMGLHRKRKLDDESSAAGIPAVAGTMLGSHISSVDRSVKNAIVLLILALGKICDHKTPLPASPAASIHVSGSTAAPTPHSVSSDAYSSNPDSPYQQFGTRQKSLYSGGVNKADAERTNVDVIPGLVYYNVACDILGGFRGGYELCHVQAALLGGLYMGQLAQVRASHDWITQAGKACQALINRVKFQERDSSQYLDLVKYCYWSCLQLESDILAELPLPQSGITKDEGLMNDHLPSDIQYHDEDHLFYQTNTPMLEFKYYWSQIQLRKTLNSIHKELYKDIYLDRPVLELKVQQTLRENLEGWRVMSEQINPELAWDDDDYISSDINAARMRSKFYGARVIVNRPSLYAALHQKWSAISVPVPDSGPPPQFSSKGPSQQGSPPSTLQHGPDAPPSTGAAAETGRTESTRHLHNLRPEIREGVEACIHAAVRSTRSLDGVPPRLIVTNIFGTGHAQFGNMLILSAAYNSYLQPLIPATTLKPLFGRTIEFLRQSAEISPTLKRDMQLLIKLESRLFGSSGSSGSIIGSNVASEVYPTT